MAPKKQIIYVNGERREIEGDLIPRARPITINQQTFGQLKAASAIIAVQCRAFACWKESEVPILSLENVPDHRTDLRELHYFGLRCPHCKTSTFLLVRVKP